MRCTLRQEIQHCASFTEGPFFHLVLIILLTEAEAKFSEMDLCVKHSSFDTVPFTRSVVSDSLQPQDCSTPGFTVHHQCLELVLIHVHQVSDAI